MPPAQGCIPVGLVIPKAGQHSGEWHGPCAIPPFWAQLPHLLTCVTLGQLLSLLAPLFPRKLKILTVHLCRRVVVMTT